MTAIEVTKGQMLRKFTPETETRVTFMDVCHLSNMAALAKVDGTVTLVDLETMTSCKCICAGSRSLIRVCRFSHDGKLIAVGCDPGSFEVSFTKF